MNIISSEKLDYVGSSLGLVCAIHCAVLPFFLTLPIFHDLFIFENPMVESSMIWSLLIIAGISLGYSFYEHHQKKEALTVASLGVGIIITAHLMKNEMLETILTPTGAIIIAIAHIVNLKLCRKCKKCTHSEK